MKLYNHSHAPNPRRVRIFAAEKGIELALEEVDILAGFFRVLVDNEELGRKLNSMRWMVLAERNPTFQLLT